VGTLQLFVLEPDRPEFAKGLNAFGQEDIAQLEKARIALADVKQLQTEMLGRKSRLSALRKEIKNVYEGHRALQDRP